ncbi:hypothetical protein TSUD_174630 [Trifolium subterraneum]|uniref:RRP12 N-terminal HEAT domain-containing protein n=1 Tax=Trifolium subterraneum TaxID=3900 RepID=A0A2Z6P6Q0_TRISU|nr:hypothetical protein TSUD_174630 [Trifolium subterraneum]
MEEEIELNESDEDFGNSILSEFENSTDESHRHLCIAIRSTSKVIKKHNLPSSPVVYLAFAISSLELISNGTHPLLDDLTNPLLDNLTNLGIDIDNLLFNVFLTLLYLVIVKVPVAVVRKTRDSSSELLVTIIVSPSISEIAVISH